MLAATYGYAYAFLASTSAPSPASRFALDLPEHPRTYQLEDPDGWGVDQPTPALPLRPQYLTRSALLVHLHTHNCWQAGAVYLPRVVEQTESEQPIELVFSLFSSSAPEGCWRAKQLSK